MLQNEESNLVFKTSFVTYQLILCSGSKPCLTGIMMEMFCLDKTRWSYAAGCMIVVVFYCCILLLYFRSFLSSFVSGDPLGGSAGIEHVFCGLERSISIGDNPCDSTNDRPISRKCGVTVPREGWMLRDVSECGMVAQIRKTTSALIINVSSKFSYLIQVSTLLIANSIARNLFMSISNTATF